MKTILGIGCVIFCRRRGRRSLIGSSLAAEHPAFEWYFLLLDAGKEQGIWTKHGLDPEFVPAAGPATEIKERIRSGVKLGFVSTAEVTLARSTGKREKFR